jgi:Mn-dependent DtxR family transcriptional regulator
LAVGFGSLAIYLAAFFFPEIHRKNDFIWSGVGFFYALVLWVFARRITGGLLLGHVASVALLGWSITQTLSLRRQVTPKTQQTPIPSTEAVTNTIENQASNISLPQRLSQIQKGFGGVFSGVKDKAQQTLNKKTPQTTSPAPTSKTPVEVVDKRTPISEQAVTTPTSSDIATELAVTTPTTSDIATELAVTTPTSSDIATELAVTTPTSSDIATELAVTTPTSSDIATELAVTTPTTSDIATELAVTTPTTSDIATQQAVVTTDTEAKSETPEAIPPHPPAPELVEAAKEAAAAEEAAVAELAKIPMEEMAPDAVLAPPAEEPTDTPNQGIR